MKIVKPLIAFVLVVACLFGLNILTAPVIEQNALAAAEAAAASQMGALSNVLPGAAGFEEIACEDLPAAVKAIYAETSGLGYAVELSTTEGYTGDAIELALGVSSEGKITGTELTAFNDTKEVTDEFLASFNEKDSALEGVELVAGVTYSSSAIRNAVSAALDYMAANGFITAGVKGDAQLLKELLPSVFPGMVNAQGILQLTEDSTDELMLAPNGSGKAGIVEIDGGTYLQLVNINGDVITYDAEGNQVDAAAVLDNSGLSSTAADDLAKISKLLEGIEGVEEEPAIEEIPLTGVFNCVTSAFKIGDGLYAFGTRPYAYSNELMPIFFIINSDGAIVKINAPEFILFGEYFSAYELDAPAYKAGFEGVTAGDFSDDIALISGATMSSEAVSMATRAAFEAFAAITGGAA